MTTVSIPSKSIPLVCFLLTAFLQVLAIHAIGINYGRAGTNLPPPAIVADFLARHTSFDRVRVYDCDPTVLSAFSSSALPLAVTLPGSLVPSLASLPFAGHWLRTHLLPHLASANVSLLLLGNEILSTANHTVISNLVPALQALHTALVSLSLHTRIKLSSPLPLSVLSRSFPPSAARFRQGYDDAVLRPMLAFLRATGAPFMVNAYPYFGSSADTLDFALFRAGAGVVDDDTGFLYTNMLDAQLDAVHSAMRRLGFGDVDIAVSETGWPSRGDTWQSDTSMANAGEYIRNLVEHINSGAGTPLMPNRTFETYIFSMFDEDMKPGPESERSFGVFEANLSPRFGDVGLVAELSRREEAPAMAVPAVGRWCVAKADAEAEALQVNIDYACARWADCGAIREGGACFFPDTVESHAAFAMNELYQAAGRTPFACDFGGTGIIVSTDPSYGNCKYRS